MASTSDRVFSFLRSLADALFRPGKAPSRPAPKGHPSRTGAKGGSSRPPSSTGLRHPYPGDFHGVSQLSYSPKPDGVADPGEIVWTWVPFEEDYSQGKDRPVLVVGRNGNRLLALMLTSKDHTGDRRGDNDYIDIGAGPWDKQGRPSEVKLDRVLQVSEADLRREGAVLDRKRFSLVADGLRRRHGWK